MLSTLRALIVVALTLPVAFVAAGFWVQASAQDQRRPAPSEGSRSYKTQPAPPPQRSSAPPILQPPIAEPRIALLIGNQAYSPEIGPLRNPHNDVALLERALKSIGFEVTTVRDAGYANMSQAINAHARRLRSAGPNAIGFFYYSGHGAASADTQTNYLIPVDVKSADDEQLWDQSLLLSEITRKLRSEAGNAAHFVVFDACRNALRLNKKSTRGIVQAKGFAPVAFERGMLIAFATAEGELTSDIGDGAGPYAKILAEEIIKPGVEAVAMFRRVQVQVRSAIGQEPYLSFSALPEIYLAGRDAPASVATPKLLNEAAAAWETVKDTASIAVLEAFILSYRDTVYAGLARARIEQLKEEQVASIPAEKAPAPGPRAAASPQQTEAERAWEQVKDSNDRQAIGRFIESFPTSTFAVSARERMASLERTTPKQQVPADAPKPSPETKAPPPPDQTVGAPAKTWRFLQGARASSARLLGPGVLAMCLALVGGIALYWGAQHEKSAIRSSGILLIAAIPLVLALGINSVVRSGSMELHAHAAPIAHVAVSSTGRLVATADIAGRVVVSDLTTGLTRTLDRKAEANTPLIKNAAWMPIAVTPLVRERQDLAAELDALQTAAGRDAKTASKAVLAARVAAIQRRIREIEASIGEDSSSPRLLLAGSGIEAYEPRTGTITKVQDAQSATACAAPQAAAGAQPTKTSVDPMRAIILAAIGSEGSVIRFRCNDTSCMTERSNSSGPEGECRARDRTQWTSLVGIADGSDRFAGGRSDGQIEIVAPNGAKSLLQQAHQGPVMALASGKQALVSLSREDGLMLWRAAGDGTFSAGLRLEPIVRDAQSLGISPSGRHIIAADRFGRAFLWNAGDPGPRNAIPPPPTLLRHAGPITAVAVSDVFAVTAGEDGLIRIWHVGSGTAHGVIRGHRDTITHLRLLPGERIVSAAMDGSVRLSEIPTGDMLAMIDPQAGYEAILPHQMPAWSSILGPLVSKSALRLDKQPGALVTDSKITMRSPRYTGVTADGGAYELTAEWMLQDLAKPNSLEFHQLRAKLELADKSVLEVSSGTGTAATGDGGFTGVTLRQDVILRLSTGLELRMSDAVFDLRADAGRSEEAVAVRMPAGTINANRLAIDRKTESIHFGSGVKAVLTGINLAAGPSADTRNIAARDQNALFGFSQNRNKPLRIEAAELRVEDKTKTAIFSGNVELIQGDISMRAQELRMYYEGNAQGATNILKTGWHTEDDQVKRFEARGSVVVTQQDQTVRAGAAMFDVPASTIRLTGNVEIAKGQNVRRADALTVNLSAGTSRLEVPKR
jgi:uncharacterized caspase-like protein